MCIGIPMQVVESAFGHALCEVDGEQRQVDMLLVGDQPKGTWVLVFLNSAREVITEEDAIRLKDALKAVDLAMSGQQDVDHLFPDLVGREPELPTHLITPENDKQD